MPTLPQLIEDDVRRLDALLLELLQRSEAAAAFVVDKGGFLLAQSAEAGQFDPTTIAALASGAFMANQTIAKLVHETNFNSVYQQGEKFSMLIINVDENCLLIIIFPAQISVGAVKYFAVATATRIAEQMKVAWEREPDGGLDLSELNLEKPDVVFRKKS